MVPQTGKFGVFVVVECVAYWAVPCIRVLWKLRVDGFDGVCCEAELCGREDEEEEGGEEDGARDEGIVGEFHCACSMQYGVCNEGKG